ncbi:hypothetical protein [Priestia megaterium]|uniref:hypothetical protein n=1 Tax=Priestia megaterium TaxID=1404 RepID=UPI000BF660E5|nr:hypothetical protein [Priestia megaterium]MDC7783959.1 hypothetical protein [Priestia megaterium]MEC1071987.1 hypothetical protein [Priestia megaterium]PER67583.1 hypothetical protein CN492_25300 [Priestia megaterium]
MKKQRKRRTKRRQKKEVIFPTFLTDASVIVVVLTGFTYLLGFIFKNNYLGYYGVIELRKDTIGSYYIAYTYYVMFLIILSCCVLYALLSFLLIPLKEEQRLYRPMLSIFLVTSCILFILDSVFYVNINDHTYQLVYGEIAVLLFLDYLLSKAFWYRKTVNRINQRITFFVTTIRNHKNFKFFALVFFLGGTFYFFEKYGQSLASHQEDYLVINNRPKDLVVIDHTNDKLLVAPVDINKKIITPDYEIIESKSTKDEPLVLESKTFKGGLKVKHVNQK